MQAQLNNLEGKAIKKIDLPDIIFGREMNEAVLHAVVKAYRANARQGTHMTKTRSTVSGGGRKPFKQKGTGEARQGSTRAPNHPGGAVVHGPQPRDYRESTNKKVRQLALAVALSDRVRHNHLHIIDDFKLDKYNTKHVVMVLGNLKATKALVVDERKDDFLYRSTRNIKWTNVVPASEINAMDVLRSTDVVMTESAVKSLVQRLTLLTEDKVKEEEAKPSKKAKKAKKAASVKKAKAAKRTAAVAKAKTAKKPADKATTKPKAAADKSPAAKPKSAAATKKAGK